MIRLQTPISESDIRALKVGDEVLISGVVFTGRDAVHKYLHDGGQLPPGVSLRDGILYHCGPVVMKQSDGSWKATAAGPTTSIREEPYQAQIIHDFGLRGVIGKGGMGERTTNAMAKHGTVYCAFTGGAAVLAAEAIKRVRGVEWLDLGMPEAMWILEVQSFGPLIVAIDTHGNNLLEAMAEKVEANREIVYRKFRLQTP